MGPGAMSATRKDHEMTPTHLMTALRKREDAHYRALTEECRRLRRMYSHARRMGLKRAAAICLADLNAAQRERRIALGCLVDFGSNGCGWL